MKDYYQLPVNEEMKKKMKELKKKL